MFSIQMDATKDLPSKDQCVSALRYFSDGVHEGVIAAIDCESSTGQHFIDPVKQTLEKMTSSSVLGMQQMVQLTRRDNPAATPHCVVYSKALKTGGPRWLGLGLGDEALKKVFGSFARPADARYSGLVIKDALLRYKTNTDRLRILRRDTCGTEPATAQSSVMS